MTWIFSWAVVLKRNIFKYLIKQNYEIAYFMLSINSILEEV